MKNLMQLKNVLGKGQQENNAVRTLYMVMKAVGGYEQLMNLALPTVNEIMKCIEWEAKEKAKAMTPRGGLK